MIPADADFALWRRRSAALVEKALRSAIPPATSRPATIHRAMRYSLLGGGKRLRPLLCLAAAEAVGGDPVRALPAACAVELVHTYSLIHDDLPCMDDDDLRRGRPTSHKVFGEGMAVLAGDALLTQAFAVLAKAEPRRGDAAALVVELASAAGSRGLIAGQVADLEAEGAPPSAPLLHYIHRHKTGALLAASVRLGGLCAGASPRVLATLGRFGQALGLAFQIQDDILDETQGAEALGKTAGKDAASGKLTFPRVYGLQEARRLSRRWTRTAVAAAEGLGPKAVRLGQMAQWLLQRDR